MGSSRPNSPLANGRQTPHSYGSLQDGYEELLGETVSCPSCRGLGRIPKASENELVALIPLTDRRLKPRRTLCYVGLAVLVCIILAGLIAFFLFPRSVSLESDTPTLRPTELYINVSREVLIITVQNVYNMSNSNFYSVEVTNLTVSVSFDQRLLTSARNTTKLTVPMRSQRAFYITLRLEFRDAAGYMAEFCAKKSRYDHTLLLPFRASVVVSYVGRTEESLLTTFQHVRCSRVDVITAPTIAPSETTTATTQASLTLGH